MGACPGTTQAQDLALARRLRRGHAGREHGDAGKKAVVAGPGEERRLRLNSAADAFKGIRFSDIDPVGLKVWPEKAATPLVELVSARLLPIGGRPPTPR